jgi:hypothetical protein
LLGVLDSHRAQQLFVYEAEDRRVRPNPERESEHRRKRKARVLAQHPQAEADVPHGRLAKVRASNFAAFLAEPLHVSKKATRRPHRLFRR